MSKWQDELIDAEEFLKLYPNLSPREKKMTQRLIDVRLISSRIRNATKNQIDPNSDVRD